MSIKNLLLGVGAAIFALVAGLSTVGTISADAATPQCGPHCVGVFSRLYGTYSQPNFIETTQNGNGVIGNPNILYPVSGSNPAEDFFPLKQTVPAFYAEGLVSSSVESHYPLLSAVQIEYAPLGYTVNRSRLVLWNIRAPGRTTRARRESSWPGSVPMRTAWTTWSGRAGLEGSHARRVVTLAAGGWAMAGTSAAAAGGVPL